MSQPYLIIQPTGADPADEWTRIGCQSHLRGELPKAQEAYHQALRINPRHCEAAQNLAIALAQSKLLNDALLTIERAEMFDGHHAAIKMNRALMALEADRVDEALSAAERALVAAPDDPGVNWAMAIVSASAGLAERCIPAYEKILAKHPEHPAAGPNLCFVRTITNSSPADLLAARQKWYNQHGYKGEHQPHTNDRNPDRPLRVGYVGGDFKCHSAAFIFSRVLLHHTSDVEMYLYSSLPVDAKADHRTKALVDACGNPRWEPTGQMQIGVGGVQEPVMAYRADRWRDISALPDDMVERLIREDKIDILVDLAGHTNGGRLGVFTRKPAPVQVTAWGFAHGTGVPQMTAFLADPVAVPPEERQYFAERIVDLPCIVTMLAPDEYGLSGVSTPPLKRNGYITFGCYARYEKLSDDFLKAVAEILRREPESRIQFKDQAFRRPYSIRRVLSFMDGISPDRLLFSLATAHNEHLAAYQQCDISLDPAPHGGGVVALECLWMGVPLLTKYGSQPSGRTAASVLTAIGRKDWIAYSWEEYIEKAVTLANNPKAMAEARKTLREELIGSPVVKDYHLAAERAYRELWREWCSTL